MGRKGGSGIAFSQWENGGVCPVLAEAERRLLLIGRLATFSYLDMWMAVAQAMMKLRGVAEAG